MATHSLIQRGSWASLLFIWLVGALTVGILFAVVYLNYRALPTPLSSELAGNLQFSEERARVHLHSLVNTIGPRPYGSAESHEAAKKYLVSQLEKLKRRSLDIFVEDFPGYSRFRNTTFLWESMDNVVAVIPGESPSAILVSAHYDSVSLSRGATDNAAAVSALLEVASVLVSHFQDKNPYYTIILTFVQGEEIGLLGAASFAEFSPRFRNVSYFLNLDGTPGDKSMNFRSSGGMLDLIYATVPRPLGFVTAMDIFNLKLIGSDTDWTMYNRRISGLDFATFSKRQTYHTLKDTTIRDGSLQFLGENILALVLNAAEHQHDLWTSEQHPNVFFSVLNRFHVVYTFDTAYLLHVGAITLLMAIFVSHLGRDFSLPSSPLSLPKLRTLGANEEYNFQSIFFGLIYTITTVGLTIVLATSFSYLSSLYAQMYAYTRASYALGAMLFPSLAGIFLVQWAISWFEDKYSVSGTSSRNRAFFGACYIWLLLGPFTIASAKYVGSTYYLTFYIISSAFALLLHRLFEHGALNARIEYQASERRRTRGHIRVEVESRSSEELRALPPVKGRQEPSRRTQISVLWYILFCVAFAPTLFIFEILVPLMELAIGALGAVVFGPIVALATLLCLLWFLPLTRASGRYGWLFLLCIVLTAGTFLPITLYGRTAFNEDYPYVFEPRQVENAVELHTYFPYSVPAMEMAKILDSRHQWTCEQNNRVCRAPNEHAMSGKVSAHSTCPESGLVTIHLSTPNAWMHNISFSLGNASVTTLLLNGINMDLLEHNFPNTDPAASLSSWISHPFRFHLNSTEHTNSWSISFDIVATGAKRLEELQHVSVAVQSIWAESSAAPLVHQWIYEAPQYSSHLLYGDQTRSTHIPDWMSFVGHGMRGTAMLTQHVNPCASA